MVRRNYPRFFEISRARARTGAFATMQWADLMQFLRENATSVWTTAPMELATVLVQFLESFGRKASDDVDNRINTYYTGTVAGDRGLRAACS